MAFINTHPSFKNIYPNVVELKERVILGATKLNRTARLCLHYAFKDSPIADSFRFLDSRVIEEEFEILEQQEPERVEEELHDLADWHAEIFDSFKRQYPITLDIVWEYLRVSGVIRSSCLQGMIGRKLPDKEMAKIYCFHATNSIFSDLDEGYRVFNPYEGVELVEHEKFFLHGVGRYRFMDKEGNEVTTIWDIRKTEPQRTFLRD